MNILVFAPHPDDELLGIGGTLLKKLKSKKTIVFLSSGEKGQTNETNSKLKITRQNEAKSVCQKLNATPIFLNLPDREISKTKNIIDQIGKIILDIKPKTIYLPHSNENDLDHKKTNELVKDSLNFVKRKQKIPLILEYEIWTPLTEINFIENIDKQIDKKIELMQLYKSQTTLKINDAIIALNQYRGLTTGKGNFCEVFKVAWYEK